MLPLLTFSRFSNSRTTLILVFTAGLIYFTQDDDESHGDSLELLQDEVAELIARRAAFQTPPPLPTELSQDRKDQYMPDLKIVMRGSHGLPMTTFAERVSQMELMKPGDMLPPYDPHYFILLPDNVWCNRLYSNPSSVPHPTVVYFVDSYASWSHDRQIVRGTWAPRANSAKVYFIIGVPKHEWEYYATLDILIQEQATYGDLIIVRVTDSPETKSIKSLGMAYFVRHYCPVIDFAVSVTDELRYIFTGNLQRYLMDFAWDAANGAPKKLLAAYGSIVSEHKPDRNPNGTWYIPKSVFKGNMLPQYLNNVYVITSDALKAIANSAPQFPDTKMADLLFTGIIAEKLGIKRIPAARNFVMSHDKFMAGIESCDMLASTISVRVKSMQEISLYYYLNFVSSDNCTGYPPFDLNY